MHDPGRVRLREPVGRLRRDREQLLQGIRGPAARTSRRVFPSTSSIAMNDVPFADPTS